MAFKKKAPFVIRFNHYESYPHKTLTHIFVNDVYFNSTNSISGGGYSDKRTLNEIIQVNILKPLLENTCYYFENTVDSNYKEKKCQIFEYKIQLGNEKTTLERIKEKFALKTERYYFEQSQIETIENNIITSTLSSETHKKEEVFNSNIEKQTLALKQHFENFYGVQIEIKNQPTFLDINKTDSWRALLPFKYKIKQVLDVEKLKTKAEKIDFFDRFNLVLADIEIDKKNEYDVLKMTVSPSYSNVLLSEAVLGCMENPIYLHIIKTHEQEFLNDFVAFKKIIFDNFKQSSRSRGNFIFLMNFHKIMPELYKQMFGTLSYGLVPALITMKETVGFSKNIDIQDIYNDSNNLPEQF